MESVIINQYFQDNLPFDDVEGFLVVVEFQMDKFFEEIGFVFCQRTDSVKWGKNAFIYVEKREFYFGNIGIKT